MGTQQYMKVLGKRKPYSGGLEGMQSFFELCIRLRRDQPFIPRGVYRFKSHEDAEDRLVLQHRIAAGA
jgi:hypothetical protein